jgi:hypothetical protein
LSHDADRPLRFTIEVAPTVGRDVWQPYESIEVAPGRKVVHEFPKGFAAHWVRLTADTPCRATAWFVYDESL